MALCVCQREWSGEAMLCCDVCGRWYHPGCVAVSALDYAAHTADPAARWECSDCAGCRAAATPLPKGGKGLGGGESGPLRKDDVVQPVPEPHSASAGEVLFCVCEQPWRGEEMLTCDSCEGWFHPLCQDMSDDEYLRVFARESLGLSPAETPPKWTCCTCRLQTSQTTAKPPPAGYTTASAATPSTEPLGRADCLPAVSGDESAFEKRVSHPAATAEATRPNSQTKGVLEQSACCATDRGSGGDACLGSSRTSESRTTRWPVGRRRSASTAPLTQPQPPVASSASSLTLPKHDDASRSWTAGNAISGSTRSESAVKTTASAKNALVNTVDSSTRNRKVARNAGWVGTHQRGSLPGAREECINSVGILRVGRGGSSMPEWWEEDLRRLAQEERQRRRQKQQLERAPKRKRHKGCEREDGVVDAGVSVHRNGIAGAGCRDSRSVEHSEATTTTAAASADEPDLPQCPICLGTLSSDDGCANGFGNSSSSAAATARTPCSHMFCRPCLMAALTRCNGPPRCPLCRKDLSRFLQQLQRLAVVKVDLF